MVDYKFYVNCYLGSAIPEKAFSGVAARAEAALARMKRIYQVTATGEGAQQLALCAMAEALYAHGEQENVSSARFGELSVQYEKRKSLTRELLSRAAIYLDIYRGVG